MSWSRYGSVSCLTWRVVQKNFPKVRQSLIFWAKSQKIAEKGRIFAKKPGFRVIFRGRKLAKKCGLTGGGDKWDEGWSEII